MTENDYIAEYIKEKHPYVLGLNFACWKIGRIMRNIVHDIIKGIEKIEQEELKEAAEALDLEGGQDE